MAIKVLLALAGVLALSGCASVMTSKEKLHGMFEDVNAERFDEAEKLYVANTSMMGRYSTYSGDTINASEKAGDASDNVRRLLDSAESLLKRCRAFVDGSRDLASNSDQKDYSAQKEEVRRLGSDFTKKCAKGFDSKNSVVSRVKKYADVDLGPTLKAMRNDFEMNMSAIDQSVKEKQGAVEGRADKDDADKAAYLASAKFYEDKICELENGIRFSEKAILDEDEAGKQSGFVDKAKLYENGKIIQSYKAAIKVAKNQYKEKFRKVLADGHCKFSGQ